MNNNGFSLLRYFADLGVDSRLYCYASDQTGGLAHFSIAADTWSPQRWQHRVEILPFDNNIRSLYPAPFSPASARIDAEVRRIADRHRFVVGSGISPALFAKAGRKLDAFYPYATGVELLGHLPFLNAMEGSILKRPPYRYAQRLQARGILEAGRCFNAEMSLSKEALDRIGRNFDRIAIPMVYNREVTPVTALSPDIVGRARAMRAHHQFVVFSHARQLWVRDRSLSEDRFRSFSKNSDWLVRGFAKLLEGGAPGAVLCLVEYGPDVDATKALVAELGIADHVLWFPKMDRREILYLLSLVDVGVGEFHVDPGIMWGGTGWEILASSKPLVQFFAFTQEAFNAEFGHPPPPLLHADSPESIARQLKIMSRDPAARDRIGSNSADWFNRHNGLSLARRWLDLIGASPRA